jgi:hypothetical protein
MVMALHCFFPLYRTSLYEEIAATLSGGNNTAQRFARYINTHVSPDALIESWEWEIDFFTNHTYHHPPASVLDLLTRHIFLGQPYAYDMYDFEQYHPDYIIDGPFSKWTELYSPNHLRQTYELTVSIGDYDLYRRK